MNKQSTALLTLASLTAMALGPIAEAAPAQPRPAAPSLAEPQLTTSMATADAMIKHSVCVGADKKTYMHNTLASDSKLQAMDCDQTVKAFGAQINAASQKAAALKKTLNAANRDCVNCGPSTQQNGLDKLGLGTIAALNLSNPRAFDYNAAMSKLKADSCKYKPEEMSCMEQVNKAFDQNIIGQVNAVKDAGKAMNAAATNTNSPVAKAVLQEGGLSRMFTNAMINGASGLYRTVARTIKDPRQAPRLDLAMQAFHGHKGPDILMGLATMFGQDNADCLKRSKLACVLAGIISSEVSIGVGANVVARTSALGLRASIAGAKSTKELFDVMAGALKKNEAKINAAMKKEGLTPSEMLADIRANGAKAAPAPRAAKPKPETAKQKAARELMAAELKKLERFLNYGSIKQMKKWSEEAVMRTVRGTRKAGEALTVAVARSVSDAPAPVAGVVARLQRMGGDFAKSGRASMDNVGAHISRIQLTLAKKSGDVNNFMGRIDDLGKEQPSLSVKKVKEGREMQLPQGCQNRNIRFVGAT